MHSVAESQAMSKARHATPNLYTRAVTEADAAVDGGTLRYRLVGPADARYTVVFENGWSGTFPYAHWFEALMPPDVRMLFYDRAGVGDSRGTVPVSPAAVTAQFQALLRQLGIVEPVVVMGHSYGGLMGVLHAAQAPQAVRALVQIDPTSELRNDVIDAQLQRTHKLGRVMQLFSLLRLDRVLLGSFVRELPEEAVRRMLPGTAHRLRSMQGSLAEFKMQEEVRAVSRQSAAAQATPRLVISAEIHARARKGLSRFVDARKLALVGREFRVLHQRQAAFSPLSRWVSLPYTHTSLVTNSEAAAKVWALTLDFLRGLPPAPGATRKDVR